jgi:hypothetical protein
MASELEATLAQMGAMIMSFPQWFYLAGLSATTLAGVSAAIEKWRRGKPHKSWYFQWQMKLAALVVLALAILTAVNALRESPAAVIDTVFALFLFGWAWNLSMSAWIRWSVWWDSRRAKRAAKQELAKIAAEVKYGLRPPTPHS